MARLYRLAALAALATLALIMLGGLARMQPASGCLNWPRCEGGWLPPLASGPIIDYVHRWVAVLVGLLLIATAVVASRTAGVSRFTRVAAWSSLVLIALQRLLGALTNQPDSPAWLGSAHLALALLVFAASLLTLAAVAADRGAPAWLATGARTTLSGQTGLQRAALLGAGALFVVLLSSAAANAAGSAVACSSWLPCPAGIDAVNQPMVSDARTPGVLLAALAAALVVGWVAARARGANAANGAVNGVLIAAGGLTGVLLVEGVFSVAAANAAWAGPALLATLTPLWGAMLLLVILAGGQTVAAGALSAPGMSGVGVANIGMDAAEPAVRLPAGVQRAQRLLADYVALTKPGIMSLLLVTTLGAMLIALGAMPPLWLTVITLLGGVLASGGANVLNCYVDRDIDARMNRTRNRASAAGRISPRAVLTYGVALTVLAVVLLWTLVNPLAALLALAGNLFYVFIYTIWLKRRTPHNIVIGGAAGAFPPLVGWAAATGHLSIVAWGLFLIVFFWTPPHFWSLALLKQGEYGRVGVPMLPNVAGEAETRKQIVIYTVLLTAVCLALAFVGLGWVYLLGALAVNGVFLGYALKLYARPSKAAARGMFFFSLWYLVLMFGAAAIDRFILG